MKKQTKILFSFDELPAKVRAKVLEKNRDVNVDYDWWDFVYEDFQQLAEYFGLDVDLKNTFFSGFYHQGQGSAYTANIDVVKLVKCLQAESWKEYAPKETFSFQVTPNMLRVCKLIEARKISFSMWVEPANRETSVHVENETDVSSDGKIMEPVQIFSAMDDLVVLVEDVCKSLNRWFFKSLQNDYDYRVSDEAIIETIKANEWYFDSDGDICTPDPEPPTLRSRLQTIFRRVRARASWKDLVMATPTITALLYRICLTL